MSKPFRSQYLKDLARECPHCMFPGCGKSNDGDIVLAHSNRLKDGKGMGQKTHDVPCYVCFMCHRKIDLEGDNVGRLEATYNSIVWLLQEGLLK